MRKHIKPISLFIFGLFFAAPVFATILTITYTNEQPSTLIRSSRWNQNMQDIQNFLNSNQLDSTDNIKAGGISTTALANLAVTNAKINPIDGSNKISGASFYSLSSIPSGAGIIPSANLPTNPAPTNYRSQMYVMQASSTTMTVAPGVLEVGGTTISKTSNTTLTLTTASDWAGGSSQQATNTTAYVGVDISGNIKMNTTAPTHADYAVSVTAANNTKRYASWSGTVYRIIGWFRMNGTGSGQLDTYGVSNIADGAIKNTVIFNTGTSATGTTVIPADNTIPQNTEGDQYMSQVFVPTNINNRIKIESQSFISNSNGGHQIAALFQDSTANALAVSNSTTTNATLMIPLFISWEMKAATTSLTTFKIRAGCSAAGTTTFNGDSGSQLYGGVSNSYIRITEEESQLA